MALKPPVVTVSTVRQTAIAAAKSGKDNRHLQDRRNKLSAQDFPDRFWNHPQHMALLGAQILVKNKKAFNSCIEAGKKVPSKISPRDRPGIVSPFVRVPTVKAMTPARSQNRMRSLAYPLLSEFIFDDFSHDIVLLHDFQIDIRNGFSACEAFFLRVCAQNDLSVFYKNGLVNIAFYLLDEMRGNDKTVAFICLGENDGYDLLPGFVVDSVQRFIQKIEGGLSGKCGGNL